MGFRKVLFFMKGNKRGKVIRGVWVKNGFRLIFVICSVIVFFGVVFRNSYYGEFLVLGKFFCFRVLFLIVFLVFIFLSCICEEDCGRMVVYFLVVVT